MKLQNQTKTTIATVKDEILETISTTKGELLTQIDTLRADIMERDTRLDQRTQDADTIYLKLQQQQQADMEILSASIRQQHNGLQEYYKTFQQHTTTTREEAWQTFKHDIEQASRHYLVHHEKKSEAIMTNIRTTQTETYRQECRAIHKEYKKKIEAKYDTLKAESMQFADQAILDLGDLLNQEKTNILDEITQDIPDKILYSIKQEIAMTLETTIAKHTDAIKEQRKTTITQIQKAAKRHTEHMEQQHARENVKEEQLNAALEAMKNKSPMHSP